MTEEELAALLAGGESDRAERKESAQDADGIRQAICAFANDLPSHNAPGVLFVGIRDNGECAGLDISDRLLQRLSQAHSDGNILPIPSIDVSRHRVGGCDVAVVVVHPATAPPVRFKGRAYVRVGPTTRLATPADEQRLSERRRARDLPFDLRPVAAATLDDLDLGAFRRDYLPNAVAADIIEQNQRTIEQQLRSLRLIDSGEPPRPTYLGVLVCGREPREFLPGDYVQFVRFEGGALTDPVADQKEIAGPLPELLRRLDEVLEANIKVAVSLSARPAESQVPDLPLAAAQQLARNAVMHRNYDGTNEPVRIYLFSDRMEIHSPGGPFGQVTPENFGTVTDYRNPHLAEAMKNLGYVQRFGIGIPTARSALEKNGNPPPEFDVGPSAVLVTIRRRA